MLETWAAEYEVSLEEKNDFPSAFHNMKLLMYVYVLACGNL